MSLPTPTESGQPAEPRAPASSPPPSSPRTLAEALPIFLRHGSPRILLALLGTTVTARLWLGDLSAWDLVPVALVAAVWPLQEWLIHVFILHYKPRRLGRFTLDFAVPRKHRAHHRDPWNYEILFIPLQSLSYAVPLLAALCFGLAPTPGLAATAIATYFALALHYEAVHFLIHTRVQPRTGYYRQLWRNHRLHHFRNELYWYGVTRLEADVLLGTRRAPAKVPVSPTARTLGIEVS